jgi:hypothetical protein
MVQYFVLCFFSYIYIYIYINDLPTTINFQFKPILFADDTTVIISYPETDYFQNGMNDSFPSLNKLFKANKLILNIDKTNVVKFCTNSKATLI